MSAPSVPNLWSLGGNFLLVLVLLGAVLWALRRVQRMQGWHLPSKRLNVIESISLGARQKIALVRIDQREILVGITSAQMTLLDLGAPPDAAVAVQPDAIRPDEARA